MKKAAMFGLDARIALAIFGALSVISGAALYSAIQQAKVTALLTEMDEYGKAYYAYALDTGSDLPMAPEGTQRFDARELVSSSASGWSGPYLSLEKTATPFLGRLDHPVYGHMEYRAAKNDDFLVNDFVHCDSADPCYVWVEVRDVPKNIIDGLDATVDGSDGALVGNFRSWYESSSKVYDAVLKVGLKVNN
tara:strand:+ start:4486 stop:5061 length:576 start_codon:yes stop_codon:yes gene_type:complete